MSFIFLSLSVLSVSAAVLIFYNRRRTMKFATEMTGPILRQRSKHCRAVVLHSKAGPYIVVENWSHPSISSKELLIKNRAIGLNPIDWKCVSYGFGVHSIPWISGREAAGTVEEVGSEVNGFRRGDRVFVTSTKYRDNRTSTFQEYVAAFPFNVGRIPDWISFEEGATLGVGSVAAAGALFDGLEIPRPIIRVQDKPSTEKPISGPRWILVWGGACVTGIMAIQLAKLSGLHVVAVAGLQNAHYLQSMGADVVLDRHRPPEAISEAQKLNIELGIDCVGKETANWAAQALLPGGKLVCLVKKPDAAIAATSEIEAKDVLIKRFHEDAAYGQSLMDYISHCLFRRTLQPVRHEVVHGGLDGVEGGLEKLRSQMVSCRKLVVTIDRGS